MKLNKMRVNKVKLNKMKLNKAELNKIKLNSASLVLDDITKSEMIVDESLGTIEEMEKIYVDLIRLRYGALNQSTSTFSRSLRAQAVRRGSILEFVVSINTTSEADDLQNYVRYRRQLLGFMSPDLEPKSN
jgi:hypothetical protein